MKLRACLIALASLAAYASPKVSPNGRFFQDEAGKPFFWLADTGWLLFQKLDRGEAERYLEKRRSQGFNLIQAVVLHAAGDRNAYRSLPSSTRIPARPNLASGPLPAASA